MKISSYLILPILLVQTIGSSLLAESQNLFPKISTQITNSTFDSATITLNIELAKNQLMYTNSIDLSTSNANVELSKWRANKSTKNNYDPNFNDMPAFDGQFSITTNAKQVNGNSSQKTNLHFSFLTNTSKKIAEKIYELDLFTPEAEVIQKKDSTKKSLTIQKDSEEDGKEELSAWERVTQVSRWLQDTLRTSDSLWFRLILAFLLGILMSLTPCIYPMIPITAGILQSQGSTSMGRSFLLALTYTLGAATTFAVFGLVAASTGHLFSQLLVNPVFVLAIVSMLGYLGLSMFGLYDMYIPKFMQGNNTSQTKGSFLSIFILGAMSGSVASPCISPGLALLLTIVATIGSKLLGFLLLFTFGFGLSMPLLIVGTFSSSINVIPQSGEWMLEIKKVFGFMLLGMCIYFLHNILPPFIISWIIVAFVLGSGIYYLQNISEYDSKKWRWIKNILGMGLIATSVVLATQAVYKTYYPEIPVCHDNWETNYENALQKAKNENKKLLIDCGADWCSICKAIDKYVFGDTKVKSALCQLVALKVDATDLNSEPYKTLKTKYKLIGVPAILMIDPHTGNQIQRWGSEIYDIPKEKLTKTLLNIASTTIDT